MSRPTIGWFAKRIAIAAIAAIALTGAVGATSERADARVFVGVGLGFGGYAPYYRPYYRPWYGPGYYVGPPPVYYAPPPVVYDTAPAPTYYAPAPAYAPAPNYAPPPSATPMRADPASPVYKSTDGRYCREYQATVTVDGQPQPSHGTACQDPDGTWRIVN